jgi:putative transposase
MASRHTEEQIIRVLKESEAGAKTAELCRQHGISEGTFYKWKDKYGGLTVSEMRRLRELEQENRRLKQIVADLTLDVRALKEINSKNW